MTGNRFTVCDCGVTSGNAVNATRGTSDWIGVDLDGTLAFFDSREFNRKGLSYIGPPIPKMLNRVLRWLAEGKKVKILTARVSKGDYNLAAKHIQNWCRTHVGQLLEITCEKDYHMIELWDDRAIQLIPNTGERVDGKD